MKQKFCLLCILLHERVISLELQFLNSELSLDIDFIAIQQVVPEAKIARKNAINRYYEEVKQIPGFIFAE